MLEHLGPERLGDAQTPRAGHQFKWLTGAQVATLLDRQVNRFVQAAMDRQISLLIA